MPFLRSAFRSRSVPLFTVNREDDAGQAVEYLFDPPAAQQSHLSGVTLPLPLLYSPTPDPDFCSFALSLVGEPSSPACAPDHYPMSRSRTGQGRRSSLLSRVASSVSLQPLFSQRALGKNRGPRGEVLALSDDWVTLSASDTLELVGTSFSLHSNSLLDCYTILQLPQGSRYQTTSPKWREVC